jgi:hypothetical protein
VPYEIRFAECVRDHMKFLTVVEESVLLDAIRAQLTHEPLVETRNRKPLRPNPLAPWELRVGPLRAFYDVRTSEQNSKRPRRWCMFSLSAGRSGTCSASPGR